MKRQAVRKRQDKAKVACIETVPSDLGPALLEQELTWHLGQRCLSAANLAQAVCHAVAQEHRRDQRAAKEKVRQLLRYLRKQRASSNPICSGDQAFSDLDDVARGILAAAMQSPEEESAGLGKLMPDPAIRGSIHHIALPMASDAGKICFLAYGVLTSAECRELITTCDAKGWHPAALEYGGGMEDRAGEDLVNVRLRDSDRCILYGRGQMAGSVWQVLQPLIPDGAFAPLIPVRINDCLRCLRYTVGQAGFAKHRDGSVVVAGCIAKLTVQLYLNDDFEGGATRLCHVDDAQDAECGVDVRPCTGMALVFDQSILHKGCPVTRGTKYTARTEVMYSGGSL